MPDTSTRPEEINDWTLISWIPFTTPGPSPDTICSAAIYQMPGESSLIAFDNWYTNIVGEGGVTCLPTEVIEWRAQNTATVISLGPFHCPSDYSTATTTAVDSVSTLVGCCPSGYDFKWLGLPAGCISTLTSGAVTAKSLYAPSGSWVSWDDITLSTAGVSVIGIQVEGYIFNSHTPTSIASPSTILLAAGGFDANAAPAPTVPGSASSKTNPLNTSLSSDPTGTMTLQEIIPSSSKGASSSLTITIITSISEEKTTIFSMPPAPSATHPPYFGTAALSSSTQTSFSSRSSGLTLGARVGIGVGVGAAVIAVGLLVTLVYMLHRRRYINAQNVANGEMHGAVASGGVGFARGSGMGFWSGRTSRNTAFGGESEEDLHPGIRLQDALPPSFLEERCEVHEAPVSSRDYGPHELDGGTSRPETAHPLMIVESRRDTPGY